MKIKTIKKIIISKLEEWLETITDKKLREDVKNNLLVSGGSIVSLLLKEQVNDYDIYIKDVDVLIRLAQYYLKNKNLILDGRKKREYLIDYLESANIKLEAYNNDPYLYMEETKDDSEQLVRYRTLKPNQVKLDIAGAGISGENFHKEVPETPYHIAFLSQNAISLTDDIQIVLRFYGDNKQIHKTFDFIHATNYFTFNEGLVLNNDALTSIITKELKYQGSLYPLTSIIRMKKFINRGWSITAGEMLKIMFQISLLDLTNIDVLEEQLIGIDVSYFSTLVEILRGVKQDKMSCEYFNSIIDKVFNND